MAYRENKRYILSQGDLDGACFLYSIINAYISLTVRRPGRQGWGNKFYKRWDKAIAYIPHLTDFFICSSINENGGTGRYDDNACLFKLAVERVLYEMSTQKEKGVFQVNIHEDRHHPSDIKKLISKNSVVIVCPDYEHWVVCVACKENPTIVYTACSAELHYFKEYNEIFHKPNNVYSNGVLSNRCSLGLAIQIVGK